MYSLVLPVRSLVLILVCVLLGDQKFEYNGKRYHHRCFLCALCKNPIGNNSFVPRDEDRLICMSCYNENFAQKCGKCGDVSSNNLISS